MSGVTIEEVLESADPTGSSIEEDEYGDGDFVDGVANGEKAAAEALADVPTESAANIDNVMYLICSRDTSPTTSHDTNISTNLQFELYSKSFPH